MSSEGVNPDASDTVSRQELAKMQQDLAMASTLFSEMKSKVAGLEAQLQQTTLREETKSTAHANKPEPFRGNGTNADAFGLLDNFFEHLFGGDQCRSNSVGCSGKQIFDRECCGVV
jgi:hypothetical protein